MERINLEFDNASGPTWVVTYILSSDEYDDEFEDTATQEVSFQAVDFTKAARYAEQYLRKKQSEDESWADASIVGIEQF